MGLAADDFVLEQADAAAQDGMTNGPKTDEQRLLNPLLGKEIRDHKCDKYAADDCISHNVRDVSWLMRGDDFRHVHNLFNETMRHHMSHNRIMWVAISELNELSLFTQLRHLADLNNNSTHHAEDFALTAAVPSSNPRIRERSAVLAIDEWRLVRQRRNEHVNLSPRF
jgi:hypothetical protein